MFPKMRLSGEVFVASLAGERLDATVGQYVRLELISTIKLFRTPAVSSEGAFVFLDRFVNQEMSLQLVLPIKGCFAHTAFERPLFAVNEHVHF